MAKNEEQKSRRQQIREQRVQKQRRQKLLMIGLITIGALVLAGLLIAPSLRNSLAPVGEIVVITPEARPSADGTALGDPNAPVLVEVWEDFQCPACRTYSSDIEPLVVENYVATGKVRVCIPSISLPGRPVCDKGIWIKRRTPACARLIKASFGSTMIICSPIGTARMPALLAISA